MICKHCGTELADDDRFCYNCGNPVEAEEAAEPEPEETAEPAAAAETEAAPTTETAEVTTAETEAAPEAAPETEPAQETEPEMPIRASAPIPAPVPGPIPAPKPVYKSVSNTGAQGGGLKKILVPAIAVSAAVLVLVCGIFFISKIRTTRVDLNDYVEVSFSGYNGFGTAEVSFDTDKFISDYRGKIKAQKKLRSLIKADDDLKRIYDKGDYKLKKDKSVCKLFADIFIVKGRLEDENGSTDLTDLSNGDTVTFKWNLGTKEMSEDDMTELAKEAFKVRLSAADYEFTVSGLEEIDTFDAFEDVEISYNGVAPNAYAEITSYPQKNGLSYSLQDNQNLANGDVVRLIADYGWNDKEGYIEEYHRIPESMEKEITVEGLSEYVTDISMISAGDLGQMKSQAEDKIKSVVAGMKSEVRLGSVDFDSAYLLSRKFNEGGDQNKIILIYKIRTEYQFEDSAYDTSFEYYYYVIFKNAMRMQDGTLLVDLNNYETSNNGIRDDNVRYGARDWETATFYYDGFKTFDELFSYAITKNIEKYNYDEIKD